MMADAERATLRIYRGRCYLLRLPRGDGSKAQMLICGGTGWNVADILPDVTSLDVLVVTDRAAALGAALQSLTPRELWLAWLDDPDDGIAGELAAGRDAVVANLRQSANRLQLYGDDARAAQLATLLTTLTPLDNRLLEQMRAGGTSVRFARPADAPVELLELGVRLHVLGPPRDLDRLRLADTDDGVATAMDVVRTNLAPALASALPDPPFGALYAIPMQISEEMTFFKERYWTAQTWRRIDAAWLERSPELAGYLDRRADALSLSLAVELASGAMLLFGPTGETLPPSVSMDRVIFRSDQAPEVGGDRPYLELTL